MLDIAPQGKRSRGKERAPSKDKGVSHGINRRFSTGQTAKASCLPTTHKRNKHETHHRDEMGNYLSELLS